MDRRPISVIAITYGSLGDHAVYTSLSAFARMCLRCLHHVHCFTVLGAALDVQNTGKTLCSFTHFTSWSGASQMEHPRIRRSARRLSSTILRPSSTFFLCLWCRRGRSSLLDCVVQCFRARVPLRRTSRKDGALRLDVKFVLARICKIVEQGTEDRFIFNFFVDWWPIHSPAFVCRFTFSIV